MASTPAQPCMNTGHRFGSPSTKPRSCVGSGARDPQLRQRLQDTLYHPWVSCHMTSLVI